MMKSNLTHRFTVRVPKYLYDEVCKVSLDKDLDYAQLIRQAISSYLSVLPTMADNLNHTMTATKNPASAVRKVDTNCPVAPSLYGWD